MKKINLIGWLWKDSHEKQTPQRFGRYAAMLLLLLTCVTHAWAGPSFSGGYAYFENKGGWNDSYIQLCIGRDKWQDDWTEVRSMSVITNTKLWYNALPTSGWGDATYMGVIGTGDAWGTNNWGSSNLSNANHYTSAVSLGDWGFGSGNVNLLTPASGSNGATLSLNYVGNAASSLNATVTIRAKVSTNGGSTFSNANTPGALTASSYKFSNYTTCGTQDATTTGSVSAGSASGTFTAGYTANTSVTAADVTGYDFVGWYEGSTLVLDGSRTGTMNPHGEVTLYAYYKVKQYTVSYGVNSSTRNGSITLNSGSSVSTTSTSTLNHGTSISFTASPSSGYQVEGWYSDAACSSDKKLQSGGTSYDAGTLTAAKTVYVKFAEKDGGVITLSAGTGGQVSKDNSSWGSSATITGIKSATAKNIYAQANTGYTFSSWSKTSGSGTITSTSSASTTFTPVAYEDATVTASFTQNMSSLTTSNHYDVGDPKYSVPSKSVSSIGIATTADLTATTPGTGYRFAGWTLSNNIVVESGDESTDLSITIRTNGNGAAATAQANYEEVLTSTWYVVGTPTSIFAGASAWATDDDHNMVMKPSGSSTGSAGSVTFNVKALPANEDSYQFKVKNTSGDSWYGWGSDGNHYHVTRAANSLTLNGSENLYFRPDALGEYTFSVNWSSTPTLSVPFPTAYTVNFGQGTGTGGSASATYSSTSFSTGTKVQNGKSITLTAPSASSGYTWDGWYNASSGGTKVSTSTPLTTTVSSTNYNFYARYTETTHTVTLANGGHGHVEINSSTVTSVSGVGIATASGTITAVPDPGYYFTGWTGAIGSGVTLASGTTSSASITINATADSKTITANFAPIWRIEGGNSSTPDAMGDWSTTANQITNITAPAGVMTSGYVEIDLPANTDFEFKVYNASTTHHWGKTSTVTKMEYSNRATAVTLSDGTGNNQTFRTAAAGTYRFTWTGSQITISYPTSYKVTFGKGTGGLTITASGSTTGSISSGDYVASGEDVTFTETHTTGYTLTGWYTTKDTGGSSVTGMSTSDFVLDDIAADATVYSRYSENMTTVNLVASPTGKGTFTCGGDAVTSVSAGVTTHPAVTAVAGTGYRVNTSATVWSESSDYISLSSTSTNPTTITATGTTGNSATLTATFTPKTYTITLNCNGATSTTGVPESVTATFDATAPNSDGAGNYRFDDITNPTKTGYNFEGWWTSNDGGTTLGTEIITKYKYYEWETSYVDDGGHWIHDGNVTVYAKWTPATYTVTLDYEETGKGSDGGKSSVTATYNAAMPTMGTAPVGATGYKFMGYFTEAGGGGTKYYNANGSSAKNWDIANNTTLYAHFLKSEITALTHEASIAKGEEVTIDVNPVINVTPEGYTAICWSLLYADTDNPVDGSHYDVDDNAEEGKPMQVQYTLKNLENGSYKIKAIYKSNGSSFDACAAGTTQNTYYSTFRIIGSNTITLRYTNDKYYDPYFLRENGSIEIPAMESVGVKAPEITGWKFWKWSWSEGISSRCGDNTVCDWDKDSINISANYDGTLTAMYQKKRLIYFNNALDWDSVYVYFYSGGYWDNSTGSGAQTGGAYTGTHGKMTPIAEGSKIYYFDAEAAGVNASYTTVAFSVFNQHGYEHFAQTNSVNNKVVYRTDYKSTRLPMFVPINASESKNGGLADYYQGYWMNYPDSTGYELRIYNQKAIDGSYELSYKRQLFTFTGDKTMPMAVTVDLEKNRTYGFKIYRTDGTYWGNNNTMTNGHSGDEGQPVWEFTTGASSNAGLTTTGAGYYTFTLSYGEDLSSNFNYLVGVRYPESSGDFRVLYKDNVKTNWRPSAIIPKATDTTIVSYFVRAGSTPYIKAQICSLEEDPENPGDEHMILSWRDSIAGANLIPLCTGASDTITKYGDGVYNFLFAKVDGNLILAKVEPYTGNFYIRVDGAGYSNWDRYISDDHLMPYSDYSFNQKTDKYSHYYAHYYDAPASESADRPNIKFVVANEYSPYISDTITQDGIADAYVNENGYICRDANIRFMYNYKTNEATRRYIDGAQESGSTFLVLIPYDDESIFDAETEGNAITPEDPLTFSDDGNWIYEANVWAVPGTKYKLKAKYGVAATGAFNENGEVISYLKGKESGDGDYEILIDGDGESREHLRLLYDFKTNRLVSAWLPSGTLDTVHAINADVMFIREGQEDVTQVTFGELGSISAIQNVYSVMRFNKWTLNNRDKSSHSLLGSPLSPYERALYWISFPYDVRLSDVFGFGTYGTHWIIEYYDGAYRAANGYWADSEANWKFVMPNERNNFVLKAGLGYILALDLDKLWCSSEEEGYQDEIWKNIQYGEIIFPGDIASIGNTSVTYNIPAHNCNITRNSRNIKDSHWNVIGVPTYLNTTDVSYDDEGKDNWMIDGKPKYIYTWNPQDNSITSVSAAGLTYHSMTAYMVQYYGNITFTTSTVTTSAAPRRYENAPQDVEFRLEIQQNEETVDQTFVRMSIDEDVTAGFEFGQDMTKEMNASKANVYTLIAGSESNIEAAGNVLPFSNQTTVVPVGVKIKTTGEYTFSIPEGTYGVGIVLIDNIAGTRTNLGLMDYVVTLDQGQIDNRFLLEISPIQQTPTDIEAVTGDGLQVTGARKVMIDGLLYIVKDGKVYDARGSRVK